LLDPGAALIYASSDSSSGSIPIFLSAPATEEKINWLRLQLRLRPNHAAPAHRLRLPSLASNYHLLLPVGSVAERVKAPFLWRLCDHERVI